MRSYNIVIKRKQTTADHNKLEQNESVRSCDNQFKDASLPNNENYV